MKPGDLQAEKIWLHFQSIQDRPSQSRGVTDITRFAFVQVSFTANLLQPMDYHFTSQICYKRLCSWKTKPMTNQIVVG